MKLPLARVPVAIWLTTLTLFAATARDSNSATVEAYVGEPFGVGRVTLPVGGAGPMAPRDDDRFTVEAVDGRVLYPVLKEERGRRLLRQLLNIDRPRAVTIYFVFRGAAPLDLRAYAPKLERVAVTPAAHPAEHARLLAQWWNAWASRWQGLRQDPQFPPVVENFLAANLSRRLGLPLPEAPTGLFAALGPKKTVWDDLLITERRQLAIDQALLTGLPSPPAGSPATAAIPAPMPWYDIEPPTDELKAVAVESIAARVPVECFYLRFGNFKNYLWFRDLSRKWQGDLGNMLLRRGVDRAAHARIEQQLSLRENAMAKILGPQVIEDVAIIGLDPYFNQGAGIGILFHARVTPLLARDLTQQRQEALKKFPDAEETTVKVGDRDVSLIATPHGEVRSYYVADGDFHLVTTSRQLVQRFLQAGAGDRPLGGSTGFLGVRQRIAHDRGDAVFVYIPPEFFRALTSPAMWIEAQRRARSMREAKVIELAGYEAAAEGAAAQSVDEFLAAGILPRDFPARGDGSQLEFDDVGARDSLRGRLGFFVPAADVDVAAATPAEAAEYRRFADRFSQEVGQMPPLGVGMRRLPLADGSGETMAADVVVTPLDRVKLGRLPEIVGEPSAERVAAVQGDVLRAEFVLESPLPALFGGDNELHHLFVGVQDVRIPLAVDNGRIGLGSSTRELVRMYVGAWPKPGLLKLTAGPQLADGPEPIAAGHAGWQAKRDDFLLMSFKPELINEVLPQLGMQPAPRPAQIWIDVGDLAGKDLAATVNALGYARARETSVAVCRLMNALAVQLHVPREACREVAESLMDGTFVCPLGGAYQLVESPGEAPTWASTAVMPQNRFLLTAPPEDFQLPALTWFKGLRGDARLAETELSGHVEVDMAKSAVP